MIRLMSSDELIALADSLKGRFPGVPLYFDLGELRGYHYHTGVVFAAFVPGTGQSIAQGGRYDNIGADFGRSRPATGFSTDLKTLVELGTAVLDEPRRGIWAPAGDAPVLWQAVRALRAAGERVVQATGHDDADQLHSSGCDRRLIELVRAMDDRAFSEARALFAISANVAERARRRSSW